MVTNKEFRFPLFVWGSLLWIAWVHLFPIAAITFYCKHGSLKQKCIILQMCRPEA